MLVPRPTERRVYPNAAAIMANEVDLIATLRAGREKATAFVASAISDVLHRAGAVAATACPTPAVNVQRYKSSANVAELDCFAALIANWHYRSNPTNFACNRAR